MNTNIAILFYSKKAKATTDGLIPIYLRVTINGQRFEVSTKRYVEESKWSSEAGRVRANTSDAQMINTFLDTLRNKVYDTQRELLQNDMPFNVETFRNKWLGITDRAKMIFEVFQHHNDQVEKLIGKDFAPATFDRYKTSMQHTKDFVKWKYKVSDLDVKKLNYEFITDYEFWLKSVQNCAHNTSMKYISNFKKIVNICLKNGWLDKDPFFGYKKHLKEVIREYLNENEIQSIIDKQFSTERLNQVKDIFVFSCFTGLAYADVQKLKRTEIVQGIDGEKWIYTQRQKTETESRIPILPTAQLILDKYKNHPQCLNEDKVLPVLSNQKMNAYLKEIADLCGINKTLTFHIARHTFATTVTLTNGVPIESVSKMLGHKDLKTTQHYAKILDSKVSGDMKMLKNKLNKDKSVYKNIM